MRYQELAKELIELDYINNQAVWIDLVKELNAMRLALQDTYVKEGAKSINLVSSGPLPYVRRETWKFMDDCPICGGSKCYEEVTPVPTYIYSTIICRVEERRVTNQELTSEDKERLKLLRMQLDQR